MNSNDFKSFVKKTENQVNQQIVTRTNLQVIRSQEKEQNNGLPMADIKGANFRVIDNRGIEEVGVCNITRCSHQGSRDQGADGTPQDTRMGNINYRYICPTCRKSAENCEGHQGIISLNYNGKPLYVYSSVFKSLIPLCLKCICFECGNLMINDDLYQKNGFSRFKGETRLREIADQIKEGNTCPYCRRFTAYKIDTRKFDGENILTVKRETNSEGVNLTSGEVRTILDRITDNTLKKMGFSRGSKPSSFILTKMLVMPMVSRPPAFAASGTVQPDGVTKKYNDIVCALERGPQNSNTTPEQFLYEQISEFLENKDKNKKNGKKNAKSAINRGTYWIKGFLDGKKGVIRDKMMGKRKNQTLRAVIAPALGKMRWGYIQVPKIAKKFLFVRETVTAFNYKHYYDLFGSSFEDCKINHIIYSSGNRRGTVCKITKNSWSGHRDRMGPGDEVERECQDGDVVLFNRQPTLGKDSMMGYTVEYVDGYVIRMHLADTSKHNADFDGDESNIHQPQTVGMKIELATFGHCTNQIISDNSNTPTIGVVFNGISSVYLLSQHHLFTPEVWMKGYLHTESPSGDLESPQFKNFLARLKKHNIDPYSAKALISSLFPADFYYQKDTVVIQEGIFKAGVMTSSHVGRSGNSLIQSIYRQYNRDVTVDFISRIYFLLEWYIEQRGLSVGYLDFCLSEADYEEFYQMRERLIKETQHKNNMFVKQVPVLTDFTKRYVEAQCVANIKGIEDKLATFINNKLPKMNSMNIMITSGSKGNKTNLKQIMALMGQQSVNGKRPLPKLSQGRRCLPYYKMNSANLEANGFCTHALAEGLSPAEFFFHASASRYGLMDTGIRVSETGSYQRRMEKVMEDTVISANCAVVNTSGSEFSPVNFDGFNPSFLSNIGLRDGAVDYGVMTAPFDPKEIFAKINAKYI